MFEPSILIQESNYNGKINLVSTFILILEVAEKCILIKFMYLEEEQVSGGARIPPADTIC